MEVRQQTDEQARLWNGPAGQAWVEAQHLLEQMFKPFEELLVQGLPVRAQSRILDVGCGSGGTSLAAARQLGRSGECVGVDISEPLIAAAQARRDSEDLPVRFIRADAQTYGFEPASFDAVISRFGVMFFGDPVSAFDNLRRAAADRAELRFFAWRGPAENAFMTTAERTAAPLLPNLPARRADAPGQFAFAAHSRIEEVLDASGWTDIDIRPSDVICSFPEHELIRYLSRLGPLGLVLGEVDESTRAQVIEKVRAAFEPYVHGPEVRFTACCWRVTARARHASSDAAGAQPAVR